MNKNKKTSLLNMKVPFLFVAILAFVLFLGDLVLFDDHFKDGFVLGASKKSDNGKDEKILPANANKLDKVSPKSVKAQTHVQKVKEVVEGLEEVAVVEEGVGNEDVGQEISDVAENIEDIAEDNVEVIDEIESRPAWKTFLVGPDYKNLGQLRSSLVNVDNEIRKINKTMTRVEGAESDTALQERLGELNQERNRITEMIRENEESFSILGWVARLLSGYKVGESEPELDKPVTTEPAE